MASQSILWSFLSLVCLVHFVNAKNVSDCSCGYLDPTSGELFTDSIIVYLNETSNISTTDFIAEQFSHPYEKSWNSIYRAGAALENLAVNNVDNFTALELSIDPATSDHLVVGSSIRSARRDIQYGSFCAEMRSPPQNYGGSSLSMIIEFNDTQSITLNLQNEDEPSTAWVSTLINGEFPDRSLGIDYSVVENATRLAGSELSPWSMMEYCVTWTENYLNFSVAGNVTRSISKDKFSIPSVPAPVYFRHWSTGNTFSMQGPPTQRSHADVAWMRLFFNASSTTHDDTNGFDSRCQISNACIISDMTLRGSTSYSKQALQTWKQTKRITSLRIAAIVLSALSIAWTLALIVHAFIRRAPWRAPPKPAEKKEKSLPASAQSSGRQSLEPVIARHVLDNKHSETTLLGSPSYPNIRGMPSESTLRWKDSEATTLASGATTPYTSRPGTAISDDTIRPASLTARPIPKLRGTKSPHINAVPVDEKTQGAAVLTRPILHPGVSVDASRKTKPPPKQRIDYLAGLVALASLLVTVIHFGLTFVPAIISPGAPVHYSSELIARKTISPLFLTFSWVGIFFTTSSRFLVSRYLKDGDLLNIAEKTVGRAPRLLIPVAGVALLEYFVMNCGAVTWLEYLPSITWSTWPYTTLYNSFGDFISELVELAFLVPNAAPKITYNYCTGVLWTIPVQLQGSWLILTGVIVIREVNTPWKRMAYYLGCLVVHWYARSWGTFLWLGLLLADLDVTYKYKQYLYARPAMHYGVLSILILTSLLGATPDVVSQWNTFNFSIEENNIHPDTASGRPLGQTENGGYPSYFVPRFSAFVFVCGFQSVVELSTWLQAALSWSLFMKIFPHILTIYLVHGLVFWSLGSWICVHLSAIGIPYWANMCVVAVCCYSAIFMSLPILTPVVDTLGCHLTGQIWEFASQEPAPRRRTLFPFPKDLFLDPNNFRPKDGGQSREMEDIERLNTISMDRDYTKSFDEEDSKSNRTASVSGPFADEHGDSALSTVQTASITYGQKHRPDVKLSTASLPADDFVAPLKDVRHSPVFENPPTALYNRTVSNAEYPCEESSESPGGSYNIFDDRLVDRQGQYQDANPFRQSNRNNSSANSHQRVDGIGFEISESFRTYACQNVDMTPGITDSDAAGQFWQDTLASGGRFENNGSYMRSHPINGVRGAPLGSPFDDVTAGDASQFLMPGQISRPPQVHVSNDQAFGSAPRVRQVSRPVRVPRDGYSTLDERSKRMSRLQ